MAASSNAVHPPALAIGGMHRSGTSLTASLVAAAGVHLGDELMAAGAGNPRGHFEDLEFYHLHQRILAANGLSMEGFTCQASIAVPPAALTQATELVGRRRAAGRAWGWKDPRTVLFLDFWAELLPEVRWLFVIRSPEDVVDSLLRRGDTAFVMNPRHAIDVWVAYNQRILEFALRHRHRSVVVDLEQVIADPAGVVSAVANVLGTMLPAPAATYEEGLLVSGQPAHRSGVVRTVSPGAHDIYAQLRRLAGLETAAGGVPFKPAETVDAALAEWALGCRTAAAGGQLAAREADARREAERLVAELETERAARSVIAGHADALVEERAALVAALETERAAHTTLAGHADALAEERAALVTALETERAAHAQTLERSTDLERDVARCEQSLASLAARCDAATTELAAALDAGVAARTTAEAARAELERRLADVRTDVGLAHETAARLEATLAEREALIERLEAAFEETRARAEQLEVESAHAAGERHGLVAQLEAERAIHEALRQDMTGRIEAASSGRGRARSAV
jgi:hypothetical protein